jgi:hypothetical protein
MPRTGGILGGIPSTAYDPGKDLGDAADTWARSRDRAADRELRGRQEERLAAESGQRMSMEREKFDMAKQMHPFALEGASLALDEKKLAARTHLELADRENEAARYANEVFSNAHQYSADELQLGLLNVAMMRRDYAGVKAALADLQTMNQKTKIGEQTAAMVDDVKGPLAEAARSGSIPGYLDVIGRMAKYPLATSHSFYNEVPKLLETQITKHLPGPAADAIRNYYGLLSSNATGASPKELWTSVMINNPDAQAYFAQNDKYVPADVQDERAAARKRAESEATLPTDITKATVTAAVQGAQTRQTQAEHTAQQGAETRRTQAAHTAQAGEEARKLEGVKQAHRREIQKAQTETEAIALLNNKRKELDRLMAERASGTYMAKDDDEKQAHEDQIASVRGDLRMYEEQARSFVGRRSGQGPATAPTTGAATSPEQGPTGQAPRGIRPEALAQARTEIQGQIKARPGMTIDHLREALDRSVQANKLSKEERDRLLESEGKRLKKAK